MSRALLPTRTDRRLKATTKKQVEPPPYKQKTKKSAVLKELLKRQAQNAAIGLTASLWSLFAPMLNIQTSGTVKPFEPYDYQVDLIQTIELNQNTVICKSRQMGISETICSYLLLRAVTEPGFSAVVFSKTQADASELGRRVRDMAISLGALCPPFVSDSATKLVFKGLGRIHLLPVTARAARGIPSVSVVVFDEAAFIDGIDGVYQAAIPTLSMLGDRGKVIFNSTPNGKTGLFYRLLSGGVGEATNLKTALDDIRQPANDIKPFDRTKRHTRTWENRKWAKVLLHWRVHPIYGADPDWAEKTRIERQLTEAQWDQEYELSFLEGSRTIFAEDYIARAQRTTWEESKPRHRYIAGVDTNLGGDDFFTVHIWDITAAPYRLVAEYRQNRRTKDYNIAQAILTMEPYSPVCISVETNNGGTLYLDEFVKLRSGWKWEGVCTTHTSKFVNTDRLVLLLERDQLEMPVGCALSEEMGHFVESNSGKTRTRNAESGWHDDTIMSTAVCFANLDDAGYSMSDLLAAIAA